MSIIQAMFNGVSGLGSNSEGMAVIADNIANGNTKAFKAGRAEFEDMLAVSLNENSQIGRGTHLRNTTALHTQGGITTTGVLTDMAIQNDGFFLVKSPQGDDELDPHATFYTRQGSFRFDRDGKLTDAVGQRIQGYMADDHGELKTHTSDIEILSSIIAPKATTNVNINLNLDVRAKAPPLEFAPEHAKGSSNFVTSVTVYDSFGKAHQGDVYFRREGDQNQNNWSWHMVFPPDDIEGQSPQLDPVTGEVIPVQIASGNISFDSNGRLIPGEKTEPPKIKFTGGAKEQDLVLNFGGQVDQDTGVLGTQTSSSVASDCVLNFTSQNGYEAGRLKSLRVSRNGMIHGMYTNGLDQRLAAFALATFPNNNGLQKIGGNNYAYTPKAGTPRVGHAETGSRGTVFSGSLEESNVDIANEFVNMIVTQRAFQANSRSVSTSDTMLEEVLSMKRH